MRALKKKKKERKGTKVKVILRIVFEAETKLAERVVISHHLEMMLGTAGREIWTPLRTSSAEVSGPLHF